MKYSLKTCNYCNFEIIEKNKMSARTYCIPYKDKKLASSVDLLEERYSSQMVKILNGNWDFVYYGKLSEMPDEFDTATANFIKIPVPGDWQRNGIENPNYLNTRYQYFMNPPHIPTDIPVGVYRTKIDIKSTDKTYLLNFLGVCACFDLFINGEFVGYSEGSHNTAEFDVTKFLKADKNEIIVVVYKWCNGTYLECQDMFRENGIFRDVFLIEENKSYLYDFGYSTKYIIDKEYHINFDFTVANPTADSSVTFELYDAEDKLLLTETLLGAQGNKVIDIKNVHEWSAEIPYLYKLLVTYSDGKNSVYFRRFVGFKHVEIDGNVFWLNNQPIKLKGINHHESHPKNGYVVTPEFLLNDIKLIKSYNCNAVRLSHYPHDPLFLMLCDKIGLYAVDEMDLEAHGTYRNPLYQRFGLISHNAKWTNHFLDRAKRMYYKSRNCASVVMWSLGNEAGGYLCQDECYRFLKSVSNLPVHYENAIHTKRFCYDVVGHFYPSHAHLESMANKTIKDKRFLQKPYLMTEYSHAMGMGPGGLERYTQLVLDNKNFLGGFIWEFCDHIVDNPEHKFRYTYGGDYNEPKHDGNFCVDGMFFPDRTPSTGALNMRECYRPYRARLNGNKLEIWNTNYFKSTKGVQLEWKLLRNGESMQDGNFEINVPAREIVCYDILYKLPRDMSEYTLIVTYTENGEYIASEQFEVTPFIPVKPMFNPPKFDIADGVLTATCDDGKLVVNSKTGEIESYNIGGVEYINENNALGFKGLLPNMYRAPIDNDRFIKIGWAVLGMLKAKPKHKNTIFDINNGLKIISKYAVCGYGKIANVIVTIAVDENLELHITAKATKGFKLLFYNDIVRFGLTLEMPSAFNKVEYFGRGERETLADFNEHGKFGIYKVDVDDMAEKYIMPQESGNRSDCRWAKVTDSNGNGLMFNLVSHPFNFNANPYTRYQMENAKHREEIGKADTTCVQIDGFMRGSGSQSCGPQPEKFARPNLSKPLEFDFIISPIREK